MTLPLRILTTSWARNNARGRSERYLPKEMRSKMKPRFHALKYPGIGEARVVLSLNLGEHRSPTVGDIIGVHQDVGPPTVAVDTQVHDLDSPPDSATRMTATPGITVESLAPFPGPGCPRLFTRGGHDWTDRLGEIAAAVRHDDG